MYAAFEAHITSSSSSSSTNARMRLGLPVLSLNFGAPMTMVVLRRGKLSKLATYSIRMTLFGCKKV